MSFREYNVIFWIAVGILALIVASPALSRLLVYPRTQFFTELWILGPNHMAGEYPYNVSRNQNCSIYLGLANHLGYCAYYLVEVKFRNESQPEPSSFGPIGNRTPSSLPSLFSFSAFVADEQVWEKPLAFSLDYGYNQGFSRIEYHSMKFNDVVLDLSRYSSAWNSTRSEFRGDLLFEAWVYNASLGDFQYHERFVSLRLNVTA